MTRLEKVMEYVYRHTDCSAKKTVSAGNVALALSIQRSDASADLNRLFKIGQIAKVGKRPVLYYKVFDQIPNGIEKPDEMEQEDVFSSIIGSKGSIKAQIDLAKAAVVYPPKGLHTLIFGESGVGKNLLAEAMWRYAKHCWGKNRSNAKPIPFVTFCCADYADNAQLLMAQLFGYVKGAFTGASEDHEGIVDRAEGGILFLDEIHRLPPTGQELLFMLVDKGVYRRLGETREDRRANLMIIGATSEDVNGSLLMTFRRRIPVTIALPRISERPVSERVHLILHFVRQESIRLGVPIQVTGQTLETFASYDCPANIGELRNDILLCCAKSYLSWSACRSSLLTVEVQHIPQRVFSMIKAQTVLDEKINRLYQMGVLVEPEGEPFRQELSDDYDLHVNFYSFIDRKMDGYKQMQLSDTEIERRVGCDLEKYFNSVAQVFSKSEESSIPISIIDAKIWEAAQNFLAKAAVLLGRSYGRNTLAALAWHLQECKERIGAGRTIYHPKLASIQNNCQEEFRVATENKKLLEDAIVSRISSDELGFITMFLRSGSEKSVLPKPGILLVAHGRCTAQSMAEVANNLLGTDHIKAYDIPLNRSNAQTVEDLKKIIPALDEGCGVILLVDMGFLVMMGSMLARETGVLIKVIANMTTALILEVGRRALTTDDNLSQLVENSYKAYNEYTQTLDRQSYDSAAVKPQRGVVLLVCTSGAGVAEKLRDILLEQIPCIRDHELVTIGTSEDIVAKAGAFGSRLRLIVGSMDPQLEIAPFVHVSELFSEGGLQKITAYLQTIPDSVRPAAARSRIKSYGDLLARLGEVLNKFVKHLSAKKVGVCCSDLIEKLSTSFYGGKMEQDEVVRIYLHAACMFDRIHAKEALREPDWGAKFKAERHEEFRRFRRIANESGAALFLEVPDGEICYFLSILPESSENK